jgi:hypothetical protein
MDEKYFVAALRRTWEGLTGNALSQAARERFTAEEVRLFVRRYLEGEARIKRIVTKEWHPLPEEDKKRLLATAFPDEETYSLPEEPLKPGDEGIAPSRK